MKETRLKGTGPVAKPIRAWILLFAVFLLTAAAFGQSDRGTISGYLTDPSDVIIPNVEVLLTNEATGQRTVVQTNESGFFRAPNLVAGFYSVAVEAAGFKRFTQTRLKLDAASNATVNIRMELGQVTESVDVVASAAQVQSESAQVGRVVETRQIQDLTLNGRNPIYLALLKPGVRGGALSNFAPDSHTDGGFTINGARNDEGVITVDGAIASRTRSKGAMFGGLNVETIAEVQILTANYNAEFGRASGGQIRFISKSGTREFHGGLWEFFRNDALDANSWSRNLSGGDFAKSPNPFRFNQLGYNIGGPIYIPGKWNQERNKAFFFVSQEWLRWRRYQTNNGTVPSAAMREGDFSELLNPSNPFFGRSRVITDPATGAPYPNNVIPQSQLSSNGLALLRAFPDPVAGFQLGTSNWTASRPNPTDTRKDTYKVDYMLSEKHNISFRGSHFEWETVTPFRGTFDRVQLNHRRPGDNGVINLSSVLSPTWINEFSFAASIDRNFMRVPAGTAASRSTYGINYPYIFPGSKDMEDKIPTIEILNFTTLDGGPYPAFSSGPIYTWSDNMTRILGNHTLKFGTFIEYSGQNDYDQINVSNNIPGASNNQNGKFAFSDVGNPLTTGVAVANAALGRFDTYSEISQRAYTPWRGLGVDLYIQDGWKVSQKLKVDYGVRYQLWKPWYSLWNNAAIFLPQYYDTSQRAVVNRQFGFIESGDPYNGIVLPGDGWPSEAIGRVTAASDPQFDRLFRGGPRGFSQTHKNVFAPRFGIAYSVDPKTAVRMGVGMFHNRAVLNDSTLHGGNPPIQTMVGVSNGSADAPAGTSGRQYPFMMTSQDPVFKHPIAWNWNFTVQRSIWGGMTVEAAYVGRRGYYLQRIRNINQLLPGTLTANPGANPDSLRPYSGLGIIRLAENGGSSSYHGFQLQAERRFSSGLGFGVAYTWSKLIDNAQDKGTVLPNAYDDSGFRGVSDNSREHVLIINYVYELPFLKSNRSLLGKMAGGWELSGVAQFQSGQPLSVSRGDDIAGVGPGSGNQFWNVNGNPILSSGEQAFSNSNTDRNFWFDPTVFSRPAAGTFGNAGRNILTGPGFIDISLGVRKNFTIAEGKQIQFRTEFFNLPNHPNWSNPTTDPTSGSFGRVQGKTGERNLQLALKFMF